MPIFNYKAIDQTGKEIKGKMDANSEKQAISQLQGDKLFPVFVKQVKSKNKSSKNQFLKSNKIPPALITEFTRQFAVMSEAGVPYDKGLEILIQECNHQVFQSLLSKIRSQIVEGRSLSQALQNFPDVFSNMYVAMVRAGEASGNLAPSLFRMTRFREDQAAINAKIQAALIYPSIMGVLGIGIVIFMVSFVLPKIIPMFAHFGVQLPLPTRIVIALSNGFQSYGLFLFVFIVSSILIFLKWKKTEWGERVYDSFLIKIPTLKGVLQKLLVYRFTQSLGTLLESGVDMKHGLEIVQLVTGNKVYEKKIAEMSYDITHKGLSLSQGVKKTELFDATVVQMIRVGEQSSKLPEMLLKISSNLELEVKRILEKALAFLEPVIILVMAVFVGFIIMSILLPMFAMNQLVK